MKLNFKNKKGFSLFITIVFMSIMLSIVIGLNTLLFSQLKSLSQAGNSIIAFYAADAGAEFILTTIFNDVTIAPPHSVPATTLDNGAVYDITTNCCTKTADTPLCIYDAANLCPLAGVLPDNKCKGRMYCSTINGTFNKTKRTIEINI